MFKDIKKIHIAIIRKNNCSREIEDIKRILMRHIDEKQYREKNLIGLTTDYSLQSKILVN